VAKRKPRPPVRPTGPVRAAPAAAPARLAARPTPLEIAGIALVAGCGVLALSGIPTDFSFYHRHPLVAVALTVIALGGAFLVDRHAVERNPRASLRFAGFGILGPVLWYVIHIGALTPLAALQATTTYRLGIGSVFPPALAGGIATGIAFGPVSGMLVTVGFAWPGVAMLLVTRRVAPRP
jgi:hypothetical protein